MDAFVVIMVVTTFVVAVGAIAWNWYYARGAQIRRALSEAPRRTIGDIVDGTTVRIDGKVLSGPTLTAPLSGRVCVFYEAVVEEYVSNGKSGSWRQRLCERRGVPFAVDDGTGRAIIDPTQAEVDVAIDHTTRSGTFDDPDPIEQAFLARHGTSGTGWVFNKSLRYREGVIEIGEPIAAMGRALREPDPDRTRQVAGYRDALPTRVRLGGSSEHPIRLSDDVHLASAAAPSTV